MRCHGRLCLHRYQRRFIGFTLVELLVVIGIIALLIGILLPSLSKARESSKRIKCLSNLRQIAVATFVYAANNRQHFPMAAMNLLGPQINPDFVTDEMYQGLGFKTLMDDTGNWNGHPIDQAWICPSSPYEVLTPVSYSTSVNAYTNAGQSFGANYISRKNSGVSSNYVYCNVGLSIPNNSLATPDNPVSAGYESFNRDYSNQTTDGYKLNSRKVLFADRVAWQRFAGTTANHGILRGFSYGSGGPKTPGMNEVYADGHGAWVDLSATQLLNPGFGLAIGDATTTSSTPALQYPPTSPLPTGYPAAMYQTVSPYNECWYW